MVNKRPWPTPILDRWKIYKERAEEVKKKVIAAEEEAKREEERERKREMKRQRQMAKEALRLQAVC